ncbi:MAG TPA: toprim domain-containing protein [Thermoplasmata archaeon]|nr:toprim domain-containing protein [Thermoplasmata archaeon]
MTVHEDKRAPWPQFLKLWVRFLEEVNSGQSVVVVEGERDRVALGRLGVSGSVILVHHGASLSALAEELGRDRRSIIVLTDWDAEGGHLAHRLRELLPARPVVDLELRRRLALVLRGEVTHVEGLYRWARRTAEGAGAPLEHWFDGATG